MRRHYSKKLIATLFIMSASMLTGCVSTSPHKLTPGFPDAQQTTLPMYEAMLAEFNISAGQLSDAYKHMATAAELSADEVLFARAITIAKHNKNYSDALKLTQKWLAINPSSEQAHRHALDVLLLTKKYDQITPHIQGLFKNTEGEKLPTIIITLGQYLATHAKRIEPFYETTLQPWLDSKNADEASAAWLSLGIIKKNAQKKQEAFTAITKAHQIAPDNIEPILFAIDAIDPANPEVEAFVLQYFERPFVDTKIRLAYIQSLLQQQKVELASEQLESAIAQSDALIIMWFLQGSIQMETKQYAQGIKNLSIYLEKTKDDNTVDTRNNKERAYLELAQAEVELKKFSSAQSWIDQINDPEIKTPATQAYINILLKAKEYTHALAAVNTLPEATPQSQLEKQKLYAQILFQAQRWQQAQRYLAQINGKTKSPDPDLRYLQALAAFEAKQFKQSEMILRGLIKENPQNAAALNALGYTLAERNIKLDEAKELLKQALELKPNDPAMLDSLGWIEYKRKNTSVALHLLERAYKQAADADVASHYGEVLWVIGKKDHAMAVWKQALQAAPENKDVQKVLSRLRISKKDVLQFKIPTSVAQELNIIPDPLDVKSIHSTEFTAAELIESLYQEQEWGKLYDVLNPINTSLTKPEPILLQLQAVAASELKRYKEAEDLYLKLIQATPDDAMIYNNLGYMLIHDNARLAEAKELIEKANTLSPNNGYILDSLGWVYFKMGDTQKAIEYLEQAFLIVPDVADTPIHLGEVLWQLGRRSEALNIWNKAAEKHPNNRLLQETLQRLAVKLAP